MWLKEGTSASQLPELGDQVKFKITSAKVLNGLLQLNGKIITSCNTATRGDDARNEEQEMEWIVVVMYLVYNGCYFVKILLNKKCCKACHFNMILWESLHGKK